MKVSLTTVVQLAVVLLCIFHQTAAADGGIYAIIAVMIVVFFSIFFGVPICIYCCICICMNTPSSRPPPRIVAANPTLGVGTLVSPNQATSSFCAPIQYPRQPVYNHAQFSRQSPPPTYSASTIPSFDKSQANEGYHQYPAAVYPPYQDPVPCPQVAPLPSAPPLQSIPHSYY